MKVRQHLFSNNAWDFSSLEEEIIPNLILCFGNRFLLEEGEPMRLLRERFKNAIIATASTAGEISNETAMDDSIVATLVEFKKTELSAHSVNLHDFSNEKEATAALMNNFNLDQLKFLFVLADGHLINGSEVVSGINEILGDKIPVAGGLAGDGSRHLKTLVGLNEDIREGNLMAIGFYGEELKLGFGSQGGFGQFGPLRTITKSSGSTLYELDNKNALQLYKDYLGEYANDLNENLFLFPLAITDRQADNEIVRTILSVDESTQAMKFAGDMPEGAKVRLMKANTDNLIFAASEAASHSNKNFLDSDDKLAILVSCVGRKHVFKDRLEEEHEVVRLALGEQTTITGFYSYGELAPFSGFMKCQLHNQTLTITTMTETE